jgi:outer membrane protein, heavy metal efflux system
MSGCAVQQASKPLDSRLTSAKLIAKDPTSTAFTTYLTKLGYAKERLPLNEWDADDLTLCALFYHTKLDVAKKKLALSNLAVRTAEVKSAATINGSLARSNQKNGDIKPWAYGLSIDIPIETNNKRAFRIEKAESNADVVRMDVAETAWQLRHQITTDLIAYHQNLAETQLLQQVLETQTNIAKMLEKRINAGIASNTEFSTASLFALKTKHELNNKRSEFNLIKAKLAADVGLSIEKFELIKIKPLLIKGTLVQQAKILESSLESKALQEQALLNRIDIRRSIAKYAAAEADIKLQVAQQTPDITLSPGVLFEFGDKIWSLGFSSLLNMLNKNTALIEEAKQLREIEGAEFEHLQASTIALTNQARTRYLAAKQTMEQARSELTEQLAQAKKMQKQFQAGLIGKVDLEKYALNALVAKQQLLASQFELLQVANHIEDIMQKPLYTTFKIPSSNVSEARR